MIRWTTLLILLGSLVAAVLYDRVEREPNAEITVGSVERITPSMPSIAPLGSSWFCAVGSAGPGSYADSEVVVANIGETDAVANLDIRTTDGPGPGQRLEIPALGSETVRLSDLGGFDAAAVSVEIIGGEGVVSHRLTTSIGVTEGPCASEASSIWHFAGGPTTRDTRQFVALFNPFPNDVVFTATFQTPTRSRQPSELEARTVSAQSVLVIDAGEFVAREPIVATTIETVGGGQLVVERLLVVDGALGPVGAAVEAGVAAPALSWVLPAGRIHEGGDNTVTVFNPTDSVAEIDLRIDPLDPADRSAYGLVPIELTVQPGRLATLDLATEADQLVLPLPYDVGVTVTSANGVPVVVHRWQAQPGLDTDAIGANVSERRQQADGDLPADEILDDVAVSDYVQPTARQGVASGHGSPRVSTRWISASTSLLSDNGSAVVVYGETGALVEVRLQIGGVLRSPVRASVDATGRAVIPLDPVAANATVIVTADAPVVAEIQLVDPVRFDVVPMVPTLSAVSGAAADGDGSAVLDTNRSDPEDDETS